MPSIATFTILLTACGGGGSTLTTSAPTTQPPVPPQSNVNISNPSLTLADNEPVSAAGSTMLVWSEEFDGDSIDPAVWFFEQGDGSNYGIPGWGNNELQYYLPDNAQVADGLLTLSARRESVGTFEYSSARLNTRDRFAFRYGRVEALIRLPAGQGLWPAFWLLPQNDAYGTWAASGEIDILEAVNLGASGGNDVLGTLHYGGAFPRNEFSGNSYTVPSSATEEFHVYALEWDRNEIRWYVDDILYAAQNAWSTEGGDYPAPFDEFFYIVLNVAVGGNLPGSPDSTTEFPAEMVIDYVRVYSQ